MGVARCPGPSAGLLRLHRLTLQSLPEKASWVLSLPFICQASTSCSESHTSRSKLGLEKESVVKCGAVLGKSQGGRVLEGPGKSLACLIQQKH